MGENGRPIFGTSSRRAEFHYGFLVMAVVMLGGYSGTGGVGPGFPAPPVFRTALPNLAGPRSRSLFPQLRHVKIPPAQPLVSLSHPQILLLPGSETSRLTYAAGLTTDAPTAFVALRNA